MNSLSRLNPQQPLATKPLFRGLVISNHFPYANYEYIREQDDAVFLNGRAVHDDGYLYPSEDILYRSDKAEFCEAWDEDPGTISESDVDIKRRHLRELMVEISQDPERLKRLDDTLVDPMARAIFRRSLGVPLPRKRLASAWLGLQAGAISMLHYALSQFQAEGNVASRCFRYTLGAVLVASLPVTLPVAAALGSLWGTLLG